MISYKFAQEIIKTYAHSFGTEVIKTSDALGRVLAEDIFADRDYPPFNRATMDGYAIRYEDFDNGIVKYKIKETILAGSVSSKNIITEECYKIMTGAPVPLSADTVIRREDVTENADHIIINVDKIKPHQSIAPQGEDLIMGDLLLSKGTICKAGTLGALSVVGKETILVEKLPKIIIYSTGDEVIPDNRELQPHQIRESNSIVIKNMLSKYRIDHIQRIHLQDDKILSVETIKANLNNDIIIITGGISMGDADYIPDALAEAGIENIIQKVAIRPGRPFWFGRSKSGTTVFALPGNPISAQVTYKLFVETFINACLQTYQFPILQLPLVHPKKQKVKLDEFFPCTYNNSPFGLSATSFNTSGDITSNAISDGIAIHDVENEEIKEGELVDFIPW